MREIREVNESREFQEFRPIETTKMEDVGDGKTMRTKAELKANGFLTLETMSRSEKLIEGLKGEVFAIGMNNKGEVVWVSNIFRCTTRGGLLDFTTHSADQEIFSQWIEESVARETTSVEIFQSSGSMKDVRDRWMENLERILEAKKKLKA